ncbi:hypothetical protein MKX03_036011 [Papaver bracteatum]|nr:hypothetical protein MKX03_036011 [Papaver bracteatum]
MANREGIESFVLVHNIAKRHNIGTMARSATAFGVSEFILVGRRDFNAFGSHGSTSHVKFRHFHSLTEARTYLKEEKDCDICGVEIADGYGCGTASLNVTVAASIVLHHFGVWAGFSERTRDGNKFVVAERPAKQGKERRIKKENASHDFLDENGTSDSPSNMMDILFGDS